MLQNTPSFLQIGEFLMRIWKAPLGSIVNQEFPLSTLRVYVAKHSNIVIIIGKYLERM